MIVYRFTFVLSVSIHTLAWRVTYDSVSVHFCTKCFNPHPRVEGDVNVNKNYLQNRVSIHTLAWRVTLYVVNTEKRKGFQSTPSRGG